MSPAPDEAVTSAQGGARASRLPYVLRQLHSLTGVVPVAVFMLVQVRVLAKATLGPQAFAEAGSWTGIVGARALLAATLVPFAFHAIYGLFLTFRSDLNVASQPYSGNWMHAFQRVTGVVALAFVGYHGARFWWPHAMGHAAGSAYFDLERALSTTHGGVPLLGLAYLLGLAACAFHLGVGIGHFATRWGLARARSARGLARAVGALTGIAMFAVGADAVLYLATGWRFGGTTRIDTHGDCGLEPANEQPAPQDPPVPTNEEPAPQDPPVPTNEEPAPQDAPVPTTAEPAAPMPSTTEPPAP